MMIDSRGIKMITRIAESVLRDGVKGFILHEVASECWKLFHKS